MTPEMIKSIASLLWPIIVLFGLYKLWPYILKLTKDATEVKIKIGDYELSSSKQTSEIFIKPILNELDEAVANLLTEQKSEFMKIYNQIYLQGRDFKLPESFVRGSEYHNTLRALRTINFIRPFGGGSWKPGQQVEIKNFGRLAAKIKEK
jgi:hypothetical protein